MSVVEKAKNFALRFHGDQTHGSLKIVDHLTAVSDKLASVLDDIGDYRFSDDVIAAAWLHDVIEDTPVVYEDLVGVFGSFIANIVLAVTDSEGKNRMERHINTYWRTRTNSYAVLVKMSDRWHNHKRSIELNEKFVKMYADEYVYFKFALYKPGQADALWAELDEQHKTMLAMISK